MTVRLKAGDQHFLQLLAYSPFQRRPAGGWSFGTKLIGDIVVDRLIANGSAERIGNCVFLSERKFAPACGGRP